MSAIESCSTQTQDESSKLEGVAQATGDSAEHAGELEQEEDDEAASEVDEMDVDEEDKMEENRDGLGGYLVLGESIRLCGFRPCTAQVG